MDTPPAVSSPLGNQELKAHKVWTWSCGYCGKEFTSKVYHARYCCKSHRQAAYVERKRENEPVKPVGRPRKNK